MSLEKNILSIKKLSLKIIEATNMRNLYIAKLGNMIMNDKDARELLQLKEDNTFTDTDGFKFIITHINTCHNHFENKIDVDACGTLIHSDGSATSCVITEASDKLKIYINQVYKF